MKIKVIVKKGFGDSFPTDKIKDGSTLNLPLNTAKQLVKDGLVDYADPKEVSAKEAQAAKEKKEAKTKKEKK